MNPVAQPIESSRIRPWGQTSFSNYGPWIAGAALLLILRLSTNLTITALEWTYACLFLFFGIRAYLSWAAGKDTKIPAWPLVCGVHFVYFGLAIFVADRGSPSRYDGGADLPDAVLGAAMLLGIVALMSMTLGRRIARHFLLAKKLHLSLMDIGSQTPARIHILLLAGIVTNLVGIPFSGTVLWHTSVTFLSVFPLAAFLWIVLTATLRKVGEVDFLLAGAYFVSRLIAAARFGASLGAIAGLFLLTGLAAVSVNRRVPWRTLGIVACLILFLQPSKEGIRGQLARGELGGGMTETLAAWIEAAASNWTNVFSGEASLESQFSAAASRTSLLTMTGVVLEKTPDFIPYQKGIYYPLLLQNLVPRVLWPDKPTVNVANRSFQVVYGITAEQDLDGVSIASGFAAEGYMNFGWPGVVAAGLLVGAVFACYEYLFFASRSSLAATAIGLSLLPGFLAIECQLVQYIGGIVQVVIVAGILFKGEQRGR